jgi:hypothetical protein
MLVQVREALQRLGPRLVHAARDHPEGDRHQRERQQRHQPEPPVDAQRHHRHHQHQRQRAVEGGEKRLAGGHFHRVDIIGGARHQVAGALSLEKRRSLQRQAPVQVGTQFDAEPIRGGEQLQAPAHAQEIDRHAHCDQDQHLAPQQVTDQPPGDEAVDHRTDLARHRHREHGHADQHRRRGDVGAPVASDEPGNQSGQCHGGVTKKGRDGSAA